MPGVCVDWGYGSSSSSSRNKRETRPLYMFCFAFSFFASDEVSSALSETADPAAERRSPMPALEFFACSLLASLEVVAAAPLRDSETYSTAELTVCLTDSIVDDVCKFGGGFR